MHITTRPVAHLETDNEARDFNVISNNKLVASTANPFDAVRAVINLEIRKDQLLIGQKVERWLLGGGRNG